MCVNPGKFATTPTEFLDIDNAVALTEALDIQYTNLDGTHDSGHVTTQQLYCR